MILYVEQTVNPFNLGAALWRLCNNLDPKRDHVLYEAASKNYAGKVFACIGLDGTRKTREFDGFERDWPNIIVADDATIRLVDNKWNQLNIGIFISSPSLQYKNQMYGEEAAVE